MAVTWPTVRSVKHYQGLKHADLRNTHFRTLQSKCVNNKTITITVTVTVTVTIKEIVMFNKTTFGILLSILAVGAHTPTAVASEKTALP